MCDSPKTESVLSGVFFSNLHIDSTDDTFVFMPFVREFDKSRGFQHIPTPVLNLACRRGYTLLQAHQKNDSHIYSEIYKLAKAHNFEIQKDASFREKIIADYNDVDREEYLRTFHFHLPVLVVDAPLVEVYLDNDGSTTIEVKKISSIKIPLPWTLSDKDHNPDDGLSIAIVTKELFPDFAKDTATFAQEVVNRHEDQANDLS